jgi:RND family efflux transporter MFP subunit
MKTLCLTILIPLLIGCAACSRDNATSALAQTAEAPIVVSVAKAERRNLVDRIELAGTLTPDEQVTVYAKVPGYLKSIRFDIGDRVRKGDLIAELDVPEMTTALDEKRAALGKAQAALEQARATVEQNQAETEFAQINYQRLKNIRDKDADLLPAQDVDQARTGQAVAASKLKNAEAQVRVAEAAFAAADAEIKTLNTLLTYARIDAPLTGIVTQRFADPGTLIQSASSSRTQAAPVVTIARIDRIRVLIDVPETSSRYVTPGTAGTLQVDTWPGEMFRGRITRTAGVLNVASRTIRAEIDVENSAERLRPGMTAKVSLDLKRMANAVTVPVAEIRMQGADRSVFVLRGGKVKELKVKTGIESPEWIQVVDGLTNGEDVVVASAGQLTDGSPVSVRR